MSNNYCRRINLFFLLFVALMACKTEKKEKRPEVPVVSSAGAESKLVADTIIYEMLIINPNPEDHWKEFSLSKLNREKLVDAIFELIYNGELNAYDYFEQTEIKTRKLKSLEEKGEIDRSRIGKIQFRETWFFDQEHIVFEKKVHSLVLGMELYDLDGNVRGYSPVFQVNLKNNTFQSSLLPSGSK